MDKVQFFFSTALQLPAPDIEYYVSQVLAIEFPDKGIIESDPVPFNVEAYAQAQLCTLTRKTFIHNQMTTYWQGPEPEMMHWHSIGIGGMRVGGFIGPMNQEANTGDTEQETMDSVKNAWLEVEWEGNKLDVIMQNRSFFLNELDGFAVNIGIVTLATTNHPERLDPAILDRPSRFDRKYPFNLPEQAERQAYISMWNESLKPMLRLSDEGVVMISTQTEGFSFAYLKELFLSSMMRWIANPQQGTMEQIMAVQVDILHEQMVSATPLAANEPPEESQMSQGFSSMMARHMRFRRRM